MTLAAKIGDPRLPLDGNIDLTYRCNNTCRHCWLWLPPTARDAKEELTFDEIRNIVDQARAMGCQAWGISGGEPMLRSDFSEIFDYITRKSVNYRLNTNGTLITPDVARLLVRKGNKMVALYGATADVHDRVTRNPGSFEATMRGFSYLREAGAGFVVQVIPMRENFHQYEQMVELAQSLGPYYRVGAPWLFLSACRSEARNREIAGQRLAPATVKAFYEPALLGDEDNESSALQAHCAAGNDDRLFAACIARRRDFHIDPYGGMSFCCFIKEPALRYNLRQGTLRQAWDEFIPSLAEAVHGGNEYRENCATCELRRECDWCPVYGYLEHGRFSAKVEYLCRIAEEKRALSEGWQRQRVRYYQIGGITMKVAADAPISDHMFDAKFTRFQVERAGTDRVSIGLFSRLPDLDPARMGTEIYRRSPWAIYRRPGSWVYVMISPDRANQEPQCVAIFSEDHSRARIYRHDGALFEKGGLTSLTTFPSDQILLARLLADRQGCFLHSSGIVIDGKGLLFVGHSEAGKSTMMKMLRQHGEILCDDRIIVRRWADGHRIHGTWSHGELPDISNADAPLRAIMFLEKATTNTLIPMENKKERLHELLPYVIKPLVTADWWRKTLDVLERIAEEVPTYRLQFDKSGDIVDVILNTLFQTGTA